MSTPDENTTPDEHEPTTPEPRRTRARDLWHRLRTEDDGYTTETIIVTATLLAIAITVLVILRNKIIAKANSINFGMDTVDAAAHTAHTAAQAFLTLL